VYRAGQRYGSAPAQAPSDRDQDVVLVGGANSAGRAALHLAGDARSVTMVVRAASLEAGMSRHLVDRITAHPRITVRIGTCVRRASGSLRLPLAPVIQMLAPCSASSARTASTGWCRRRRSVRADRAVHTIPGTNGHLQTGGQAAAAITDPARADLAVAYGYQVFLQWKF
jgi:hypothetical protein